MCTLGTAIAATLKMKRFVGRYKKKLLPTSRLMITGRSKIFGPAQKKRLFKKLFLPGQHGRVTVSHHFEFADSEMVQSHG